MGRLKDLQGATEVHQYFEELKSKPFGIHQQARIYGMAYQMQELLLKEEEVEKIVKKQTSSPIVKITIIDDSMAIAETIHTFQGMKETVFFAVVNGKCHFEGATSFDKALAMALCVKYGFPEWHGAISNMLQMDAES